MLWGVGLCRVSRFHLAGRFAALTDDEPGPNRGRESPAVVGVETFSGERSQSVEKIIDQGPAAQASLESAAHPARVHLVSL